MRPISPTIKKKILADKWYKKCCLCDSSQGKIDWHHNFIFGGRQVDEFWAILPLCIPCHRHANNREIKEKLDWMMIQRMKEEDFKKYSRYNWRQRIKYLTTKFNTS
jgi:hypothetical protein